MISLLYPPFSGQIQFISLYRGKNITAFVGDSVQFTWRYSGDVSGVTWGLKQDSIEDIIPNGYLMYVNTKTGRGQVPLNLPVRYNGRVSGTFSGDQFSGQVKFTLTSLENDDDRFYGCKLDPVNDFASQVFDYVYLVVQGELLFKILFTIYLTFSGKEYVKNWQFLRPFHYHLKLQYALSSTTEAFESECR